MKNEWSLADVIRLIDVVNNKRTGSCAGSNSEEAAIAEQQLNEAFGTNNLLAVYGTLAPGRQNYHIVEPLGGDWSEGIIEGNLQQTGWGATLGYPAFRPQSGGPVHKIKLLKSRALASGWQHVDDFEGPDYQRILVPVFRVELETSEEDARRLLTVANLYAAKDDAP